MSEVNIEENFSEYNKEGSILRMAQKKMLEILIVVDEICKKNNIPYWIDYGTLLGAVRHGGFIPWDDDLDITILKKDYKRFAKIVQKELPPSLVLQDWKNEKKLFVKMGKIRDLNTYYDDGIAERGGMKYQGIFIDVFPVDFIPSYSIKKKIDFLYGKSFRRLRRKGDNKLNYILSFLILPIAMFLELISKTIVLFSKKTLLSNIYGGLNLPVYHHVNDIFPLKEIEFEGVLFQAPNNHHEFLKSIYGDYMKIPKKENRKIHAREIDFIDLNMSEKY